MDKLDTLGVAVGWLTRNSLTFICVWLILLVSVPIVYWRITINQTTTRPKNNIPEPCELYFYESYPTDNETFMKVWNLAKDSNEMAELSKHGNYSVLILSHVNFAGTFSNDPQVQSSQKYWFVVASTLQPSSEGLIYWLVLTFDKSYSFVKSKANAQNLNITSVENGKRIIEAFINEDPNGYYLPHNLDGSLHGDYHFTDPFLTLVVYPSDFGITIILNLNTGTIMVVAHSVWA